MATAILEKRKCISADEFERDFTGVRAELIKGRVRRMSPAGGEHGVVAQSGIGWLITSHVRKNKLGVVCAAETGFRFANDTVRAPDVAFISKARLQKFSEGKLSPKFWTFAPDLAVEVVSPYDRAGDVQSKVAAWLEFGALAVWIVYPRTKSVVTFTANATQNLKADDALEGGAALPGFRCEVSEIFDVL